ncbi:hypothetical protein BDB00DRAFT_814393 [Zychaea mexicana]|uniref:uncharacterized protein n=1 Tax=Zychaea mexicana TaxID=64656 RepID=UPI0022FE62BD|nr:uncharacterized protein BDB00DRAFT_814393 [Zychaea mexicana]KAI9495368.1 hypothetical protein BDB00DRAFT_814393 [Zychaea mexicana]
MMSQLKPPQLELNMSPNNKHTAGATAAATATAAAAFQSSGPPSPSLSTASFMSSVSWMAEKSSTELIPMLKNAYSALKDKERDLMLAAEIGKSLLENNIRLKTSYEDLLQQTQKSCSPTTTAAPLPTPSSSLPVDIDSALETGSSDDDDDDDYYDDDDGEEEEMRFIPSHRTREAMIEVLERKNVELSKRLESAIAEREDSLRNNTKKTRKLEAEIEALKSNLEIATAKIQELEEMNQRQHRLERKSQQQLLQAGLLLPYDQQITADEMEELLGKIDTLEVENKTVSDSKTELETKLAETLKDLRLLKEQFEQFQFTQDDYETLQEAYERQFRHIAELNESVEEHRGVLQKLKDRGINIHSARSTPAPSVCGGSSVKSQPTAFRNTLLGELETEWLKRNNSTTTQATAPANGNSKEHFHLNTSNNNVGMSLNNVSQFTEKALATFYNAPTTETALETVLSKASGIDKDLLDEALSFISHLEDEHDNDKCLDLHEYDIHDNLHFSDEEDDLDYDDDDGAMSTTMTMDLFDQHKQEYPAMDLYPNLNGTDRHPFQVARVTQRPKTFLGRIRRIVHHFFRAVWRWCRFAMILTTAVLISLWRGPEGMLIEYR